MTKRHFQGAGLCGVNQTRERAEAIQSFIDAYRHSDGPIYVLDICDAMHNALQAKFDISAKVLRAIKQRMERELKAKAPKALRRKPLTVCPHCQGSLTAINA